MVSFNRSHQTILVYCEGPTDKAFVQYLHDLFNRRNKDPIVKLYRGSGGTANGIVANAAKLVGSYTKRIAVLDNDKSESEMKKARRLAEEKKILLVEHTPCIEAVLLKILMSDNSSIPTSSGRCKRKFNNDYFRSKNRSDWEEYRDIFPKGNLKLRKKKVAELEKLIRIVRGICD